MKYYNYKDFSYPVRKTSYTELNPNRSQRSLNLSPIPGTRPHVRPLLPLKSPVSIVHRVRQLSTVKTVTIETSNQFHHIRCIEMVL